MTLDQAAWLVLGLDAAMIVFTLAIFVAGGVRRRTAMKVALAGAVWLVVLRILFANDLPFPADIGGVAFYAVVLVGVALIGLGLLAPRSIRSTLTSMSQATLLAPQGIRVFFGATFLLWAGEGILPRTFGIIDGFTHVTAGFLGLAAAWAAARRSDSTIMPWIANVFGLADILIVATSISFVLLDDIGPHHPMMYAVFAPAPIWLWLHVVSIQQLIVKPAAVSDGDRTARTAIPDVVGASS